jgi:hypothetical protein
MKKFRYIKKETTAFSLRDHGDFILVQGKEYTLPEDNAHVRTLKAHGHIEEVKEDPGPVDPEIKPEVKVNQNKPSKKSKK